MSAPHPRQSDEPGPGPQLPLLHQVAYCSRAAPEVDASTVERIVATARRTNPAQGITGLLVFGSGVFFQWLEGPRDHITGLMAKILRDPRHDEVVTLSHSEEVRERLFPDWSMELVTPDQIREVLLDAFGERGGRAEHRIAEPAAGEDRFERPERADAARIASF